MQKFLPLCLLLFTTVCLTAQDEYQMMDWGEIPSADLNMTVYSPDTTAQAIILGDQGYMEVDRNNSGEYEYLLRRHKRIKILAEAAQQEYGDVSLYYSHKDGRDRMRDVDAQAITPEGEIIPVNKDDIFREKVNDEWTKLTFSFPAVPVGSVLEMRYKLYSRSVLSPTPWRFREEIPVRSSYFEFSCKAPIVYTYLFMGAEFMKAEKRDSGVEELRLGDTRITIEGTRFWLQNGNAVVEEPFMTSLDDYYINVRFQASATFQMGKQTPVYGTWEQTNQELLDDEDLGFNFTKKRKYKDLLAAANATIGVAATQEEILYAINRFITKEISWSGDYGIWTKQTPDEAFAKHQGSVAEIQYAGLALLREHGIKAYPIVLSTRSNGAMITTFPFLRQFNYVVVIVEIDDVARLVDFTDPFLRPGVIRTDALNGLGFMLNEDNPTWMQMGVPIVRDVYVWGGKITAEGHLEGQMKATMHTISGRNDRVRMEEESLVEVWSDRLPNGTILTEMEAKNEDDVREPLIVSGKFEIPEAGFANDDFLYVTPLLFTSFEDNPLKSEKRDYPVDFPYPFEEKSIYQYELPEGYVVESLPEEKTLVLPNSDAQFQYLAQEKPGRVSILMILKINKTIYSPEEYSALRELFEVAAGKMAEQVVLRKG